MVNLSSETRWSWPLPICSAMAEVTTQRAETEYELPRLAQEWHAKLEDGDFQGSPESSACKSRAILLHLLP